MASRSRSRAQRKREIIAWMQIKASKYEGHEASATEIAHGLDLVPSWHVLSLCLELVSSGDLLYRTVSRAGAVESANIFRLSEKNHVDPRPPSAPRFVPVKQNGETVTQLRLPK